MSQCHVLLFSLFHCTSCVLYMYVLCPLGPKQLKFETFELSPCIFSAKSCGGIFMPRIGPPRRSSYTVRFKVSVVEWQRKNEASIHRTAKHFSIDRKHSVYIQPTWLSTVKLSTANADRPQQRWTRQLLRGSALLLAPQR